MNIVTLERYKGSATRHTCPACGRPKTFVRYVDSTGAYLADHVGRCNRESKCGYHLTPRQYFLDTPDARPMRRGGGNTDNRLRPVRAVPARQPQYLDLSHLLQTIGGYDRNSFVNFLFKLFPHDPHDVEAAITEYLIGTMDDFTVFPVISWDGNFCKAQLMKFDRNGHTRKYRHGGRVLSSLQAKLKAAGLLPDDFETDKDVFFGEHLLPKYPDSPVAIVEAAKTAVIASICKRVFPDLVWLAAGSKQWLNVDRIMRVGEERTIILFPDGDGYDRWWEVAFRARQLGVTVEVSDVIEKFGSRAEKERGADLADYLVNEQQKRNDPLNRETFSDLIEERLAIMTIDGTAGEQEAKDLLKSIGFIQLAESIAICPKA